MLTLGRLRTEKRREISDLAARLGARNVRVFRSIARGEPTQIPLILISSSVANQAPTCTITSRLFTALRNYTA
jgi:hypothetical protein